MAIDLTDGLALSVVMPVRDGAGFLPHTLSALRGSDLPPSSWELIVVDDGSRDGSAEIAAEYADRVIRLPAPAGGPPAARNRGAEVAQAPVIVFVDADICVHGDALRRIRDVLAGAEDISAVFGAYDLTPAAPAMISQYRNLLHSYVHRRDAGEAATFWTGLGAIRRRVFEECRGFDERERLDDVELGYRVSALGHRIVLNPDIQGTHLKRWTLSSVITTDVLDRGVPWVRLLLQRRRPPGWATLNVRGLEQLLTAVTGLAIVAMGIWVATGDLRWLLGSGLAAVGIIGADWRLLHWLASQRGAAFALRAVPLRLLHFHINIVSVGLALLPIDWRRPTARQTAEAVLVPSPHGSARSTTSKTRNIPDDLQAVGGG